MVDSPATKTEEPNSPPVPPVPPPYTIVPTPQGYGQVPNNTYSPPFVTQPQPGTQYYNPASQTVTIGGNIFGPTVVTQEYIIASGMMRGLVASISVCLLGAWPCGLMAIYANMKVPIGGPGFAAGNDTPVTDTYMIGGLFASIFVCLFCAWPCGAAAIVENRLQLSNTGQTAVQPPEDEHRSFDLDITSTLHAYCNMREFGSSAKHYKQTEVEANIGGRSVSTLGSGQSQNHGTTRIGVLSESDVYGFKNLHDHFSPQGSKKVEYRSPHTETCRTGRSRFFVDANNANDRFLSCHCNPHFASATSIQQETPDEQPEEVNASGKPSIQSSVDTLQCNCPAQTVGKFSEPVGHCPSQAYSPLPLWQGRCQTQGSGQISPQYRGDEPVASAQRQKKQVRRE
ncbi:hypothetical protein BaRGS_00009837 [Batillaria attramentaria]|uniref:Uncharacterized protein n=1 Tax=Batillaria attramentaria TaxID=370345 RepID=A0ABD0LHZ1_9CAEN